MSSFFKRMFSLRERPGIRLIIFDFDGTLADTKELLLRIVSKHLAKFNISMTKNLIISFGNAPLVDFVSTSGLRKDFVRSVSASINDDFLSEYEKIKPCKGLLSLKKLAIRKTIVSNNITPFIERTLGYLHADFFDAIYGSDRFKDKVHAINSLCRKYRISPNEVVYVADKAIDVKIARDAGCYCVIVSNKSSWSKHTEIVKEKPDYLIGSLGKLPRVIERINMEQFSVV